MTLKSRKEIEKEFDKRLVPKFDHYQRCKNKIHDGTCDKSYSMNILHSDYLSFIHSIRLADLKAVREMVSKMELEDGFTSHWRSGFYQSLNRLESLLDEKINELK